MVTYNTERPHQGYRNWDERPIDTVREYLQQRGQTPDRITPARAEQAAIGVLQPA